MTRRFVIAILPVLFLISCGESNLLVPELEPEEEYTIATADAGSIFQANDAIPVEIKTSGAQSTNGDPVVLDRLEVTLSTIAGEVFGSSTISGAELSGSTVPEIGVPDVEPGEYVLTLVLFKDGEEVSRTERRFFVADGSYVIDGVTAYPPSFFPASSGILRVQVDAPEEADPYLRWTMDGRTIAEGYASDGLEEVLVKSASAQGVYPVLVELFPTGPTDSGSFPFESSAQYTSQIVVRRTADLGENDLAPEASYYSLFHFMGNFRDDGSRVDMFDVSRTAEALGSPDLRVTNGVFGYHLDGESGFRIDDFILPVRDGRLSAFSVSARVLPEDDGVSDTVSGPRNLFRAETDAGDISLQVRIEADGAARVELSAGEESDSVVSGQAVVQIGEPGDIVISLLPGRQGTTVVWFVDGEFVWADSLSVGMGGSSETAEVAEPQDDREDPQSVPWQHRSGESVIGGEDGFIGVIDEFGIYFRDEERNPTSDLTVFRKAQERLHGENLVYAGGFEQPDSTSELEEEGEVQVDAGDLVLQPGGSVMFPDFLFHNQDLILEIEAEEPTASPDTEFDVRTAGDEPALVLTFFADGSAVTTEEGERFELLSVEDEQLRLRIRHNGDAVAIGDAAADSSVEIPVRDFSGLQLRVRQPTGSNVRFRIRSVLAFTENSSLSRALAGSSGDSESNNE